ncbi:MAG: hypothetical protein AAF577_06055 [Pseudomonadota bacterium]
MALATMPGVIAIGRFDEGLVQYYEYPADCYRGTRPGREIVTRMLVLWSQDPEIIARYTMALGISDVWDFSQHVLDPGRMDTTSLHGIMVSHGDDADLQRLAAFDRHGYRFFFSLQAWTP